ncbi:Tetratricopeptide repeat protein 26 [Phytophthora nicotianae]|uniref:Tetratricopeptide repeat protein 26 n=1 Tax=Phytophthora nicotianae TaxID=4792 RepID=A0A0W8DPP1_PHYNI|nr:Tetratricopeptide repeat protein 26 [Phytophthora nicotianae]
MGGKSRAALRREKKRKQKGPPTTSGGAVATVSASDKARKRQQTTIYDSDSDSSDDNNRAAAIPLPSLEDGDKVRDFAQELETQRKPRGKRARAEAEQHAVDQRKKKFREEKAEKIVWRKFDRENQAFEKFYERCLGLEKDEFARFLACLREPLPVHLRVNGNYTSLSEIVTGSLELDFDLKEVTVPTPVGGGEMHVQFGPESWVPEKRLWKLSVDSKMFRKVKGLRSLIIRKVREPNIAVVAAGPALPQSKTKPKSTASKNKKQAKAEKPFGSFTPIDKDHLSSIQSFFALRSNSSFLERAGMARQKRAVHVVTPAVAELVTSQLRGRLSIYHAGVFALRPGTGIEAVADELTDDGARALLPEMNKRVLSLPQDEFTSFLESREMWLKNAGEHAREQLADMAEGSLAVALDDMEPAQTGDRDIVLVAVKRHNSCSIVSSPAAIARIKALLEELNDTGDDGDDGYDSFEFEDE